METWLKTDIPASVEEVEGEILSKWGFSELRDGQRTCINAAPEGRDCIGVMPTGFGKSLAFQAPALLSEKGKTTLVISPLIALMRDQVKAMVKRDLPAAALYSGLTRVSTQEIYSQTRDGAIAVIFVSPERLSTKGFRREARDWDIERVVVDEAHCISEWGHSFRADYLKIGRFIRDFKVHNASAFTATASSQVRNDIQRRLHMEEPEIYVASPFRENLDYTVSIHTSEAEKKREILEMLQTIDGKVLVYCATRMGAENLAQFLCFNGVDSGWYHAGIIDETRRKRENEFKQGKLSVMAATNAFGMGIDIPDIRAVVHFDIPASVAHYLQETGRAGRDGDPSECRLLYSPKNVERQEQRIRREFGNQIYTKQVYSRLLRQHKQRRAAGVASAFNRHKFLMTMGIKRPLLGSNRDRVRKVNAALATLENSGLARLDAERLTIKDVDFDNEWERVDRIISRITAARIANLKAIQQYAESEDRDQNMIIDLNEQIGPLL